MNGDQFGGPSEHEASEGDETQAAQDLGQALVIPSEAAEARHPNEAALHGLIANDKFCLTRTVRLRLSWPRARVRRRVSVRLQPPGEVTRHGEEHAAAAAARLARPANRCASGNGPAALGPSL